METPLKLQASTHASSPASSLKFVYPKKHGIKTRYVFGKKHQKQNETPSSSSQKSPSGEKLESESIDDILFPKNSKKAKKRQSSTTGEDDAWTFADSENKGKSQGKEDTDSVTSKKSKKRKGSLDETDSSTVETKKSKQSSSAQSPPVAPPSHLTGVSVEEAVRDKAGLRPRANSTDGELELPRRGLCDETMVLQSYKWADSVKEQKIPKGLHNLGNTCFLNSTIQCLAYLPPFVQSILSIPSSTSSNKKIKGKIVTHIVQALFRRLHNSGSKKKTQSPGNNAVTPRDMAGALDYLSSYKRGGYKFRRGRQEDAHEFLVHLLDCMNDGELREAGINQEKSGWRDRLPVPRLDQTTFVHRVFGGYFRSQVKCGNCEYKSNTYDPFLDLSLEVNKNCRSLDDALREFSRKEVLDSDNRWKCSGCKKRVRATKQLTVFRPPLSLCIQLKRFSFSEFGGFGYGGSGQKITKRVSYPANLRLPLSDGRSCEYQLTGAVLHLGHSPTSGHYTAFVRKPTNGKSDKWFYVDDSFADPQPEENVLQSRDAYLLFYSRKTVKLDFPQAMPPMHHVTKEDQKPKPKKQTKDIGKEAKVKAPPPEAFNLNLKIPPQAAKLKVPLAISAASIIGKNAPTNGKSHKDEGLQATKTKVEKESCSKPTHSDQPEVESLNAKPKASEKKVANQAHNTANNESKIPSRQKQKSDQKRASARPPVTKRNVDLDSSSSDSESSSDDSDDDIEDGTSKTSSAKASPQENSSDSDEGSDSVESDDKSETNEERLETPSRPKTKQNENETDVFQGMFGGGSNGGGRTKTQGLLVKESDANPKIDRTKGKKVAKATKRKPFVGKSSMTFSRSSAGAQLDLLGNTPTSKWETPEISASAKNNDAKNKRNALARSIKKQESSAKRKLHNDRWDSGLDAGRTPKKKKKKAHSFGSAQGNRFQHISNSLRKGLNKRKA